MKLPRDVKAADLIKALASLDYVIVRQRGSHIGLVSQRHGEHHLVIPNHNPIKAGMLNRLIKDVAEHHAMSRDELIEKLGL